MLRHQYYARELIYTNENDWLNSGKEKAVTSTEIDEELLLICDNTEYNLTKYRPNR